MPPRRRLIASMTVAALVASVGWVSAARAASPPQISVDAATVTIDEGSLARMAGTWSEPDGDAVTFSTSLGQIEADPNNHGRWRWDFVGSDGPFAADVTVTITDADGSTSAGFHLSVTNEPPIATTKGPAFVPSGSVSDRVFLWSAGDVPKDTLTTTTDCGSGTVIAQYPTVLQGEKAMRCHFSTAGPTKVGVRSSDEDGGTTDGRVDVIATPNVRSIADAHLRIDGSDPVQLGGALAAADLDDDGFADVAIGGTATSNTALQDPAYVDVVLGRSGGGVLSLGSLPATARFRISGPPGIGFGRTLAAPGDLNGDGRDDLVIGSYDGPDTVVYVVFGSPTIDDLDVRTMSTAQGALIRDADDASRLGRIIAAVGDVNGDGRPDVAVGGSSKGGGGGRAAVIYGRAGFNGVDLADLPTAHGFLISGSGLSWLSSLAGADVNGDGRSDVVASWGFTWDSAAVVMYGRTGITGIDMDTVASNHGFRIGGGEGLGISAVAGGDMNGDGFAEVAVVHDRWTSPNGWAASIIKGAATNASIPYLQTATASRLIRIADDDSGISNDATMLDWDDDGRLELVIGARFAEQVGEMSGSVYVIKGRTSLADVDLATLSSAWIRIDADNWYAFGGDAVAAGDVTGDGVDDLLVGAPGSIQWMDTNGPVGRVGVFRGGTPDSTPPTVSGLTRSVPLGKALVGPSPVVRVTWSGSDAASGVAQYEVAWQVDGGTWASLGQVTSKQLDRVLSAGHDYRFRVRATDKAGNRSAWSYGTTFRVSGFHEHSPQVTYRGSWSPRRGFDYVDGQTKMATTAGAQAILTFTGRDLIIAGPVGPTRGRASVTVDGKVVGTIDQYAVSNGPTRVLGRWSWSSSATRTVTIRVNGTAGHPRFDVDRIIVLR